ncbi:MAG: cell division protein ZapB [Acidobacteriota bacterium]
MAIDWMETLEERVREAAKEIRRLRSENTDLQKRVAALTTELEGAHSDARKPRHAPSEVDAAWEKEREEVRGRVERLVKQLEGLIQEAGSSES